MDLLARKKAMGKKIKPSDKFRFNEFGERREGSFFNTAIGFRRVYKKPIQGNLTDKMTLMIDMIQGQKALEENGVPVVKFFGLEMIGPKRDVRASMEKARSLSIEEAKQRADEVRAIIKKASDKRVKFDAKRELRRYRGRAHCCAGHELRGQDRRQQEVFI